MKPFTKFKPKLEIKSHWLILMASFYFAFVLNLSLWRFVLDRVEVTDISSFMFAATIPIFMLAPLYAVFNLIVVPYIGKPLLIILVLVSSGANYFMYNLGVYIDLEMIRNVFETDVRETLDLTTLPKILWIFTTGIIPAALIVVTKIKYQPFWKEAAKRGVSILATLAVAGIVAAALYKEYASFGRNNKEAGRLLNPMNYITATTRYFKRKIHARKEFQHIDDAAIRIPSDGQRPRVLVVVLGEAARAKNFSLQGYERETNPLLKEQDIVYFKDVISCGTSTAVSVPCMFSHLGRKYFNVDAARYYGTLLDVAQTAGYRVLFRGNNSGCKGICDRVEVMDINNPKYCAGRRHCYDEALLDGLPEILANIKHDTLIVLYQLGSHGPAYHDRYPERFRKFTPTCDTSNIQGCSQEHIVNTYDNTILYTDFIVSSAIDMLKKHPEYDAGLIYVSDHGQSLGENNIYLHGFPYAFAPKEQKHVPMLVWLGKTMQGHIDYGCLKKEAARNPYPHYSHDNLFHSVLGILDVRSHTYKAELDIFKNCRI